MGFKSSPQPQVDRSRPEDGSAIALSLTSGGLSPLSSPSDSTPLTLPNSDLSDSHFPGDGTVPSEVLPQGEEALAAALPPLFPAPKRTKISKWLWLGVIVSLGLHAGLMLFPTGEQPKPTPPKDSAKQVRITQLPKLTKTVTVPKKIAKPTVKPLNRTVALNRSVTRPLAPPIPQPLATPKPQTATSRPTPANSGSSSWDDFPLYPGTQQGCYNLAACLQTSDGLGQVADYYNKELPAKKYELKPAIKEAGRQVFQVSRNGQAQFLSLLQSNNGTVMVLSDAPRSLEDLKKAVEVPPEVSAILSNLDAQNADASSFAQPDLFYTKAPEKGLAAGALVPKAEIRNISLVSGFSYDTMMDEFFRSNLQNNDFEVTDIPQSFGAGKVYKVTKGSLTLYLNLVPTKDNSGTLVVTWKDLPK